MTDTNTSGADVLAILDDLANPDPNDRDVLPTPASFRSMHDAVAALIEREAVLTAECAALTKRLDEITTARTDVGGGSRQLLVYGGYDAIKTVCDVIERYDEQTKRIAKLLALLENVRDEMEASGGWEGDDDLFGTIVDTLDREQVEWGGLVPAQRGQERDGK